MPASYISRVAVRRILPLDVFGTAPGGTSATTSGGRPTASAMRPVTTPERRPFSAAIERARLRHHHQALRAQLRPAHAEGDDAAAADAGHGGGDLFDLLRDEVAAGLDDEVLPAAGDEDLAVGHVGEVAAVEPPAGQRDGRRRLRLAVVARGGRGPAKDQAAHGALRDLGPRIVDQADLVLGQRAAHGHEAQRAGVVGAAGTARRSRSKAARATGPLAGARPTGGKDSPTELSARP